MCSATIADRRPCEKKLFFRQIEAVETAVYLIDVAHKFGDAWIANQLRQENDLFNPGLPSADRMRILFWRAAVPRGRV